MRSGLQPIQMQKARRGKQHQASGSVPLPPGYSTNPHLTYFSMDGSRIIEHDFPITPSLSSRACE